MSVAAAVGLMRSTALAEQAAVAGEFLHHVGLVGRTR